MFTSLCGRSRPSGSTSPGWSAHADGGSGVVAGVVETPWTGSATRDAVRHRDAQSSADAGLDGRDEPA